MSCLAGDKVTCYLCYDNTPLMAATSRGTSIINYSLQTAERVINLFARLPPTKYFHLRFCSEPPDKLQQ